MASGMPISYNYLYFNDPETYYNDPLQDQQSGSEDKYGGEVYDVVSSC